MTTKKLIQAEFDKKFKELKKAKFNKFSSGSEIVEFGARVKENNKIFEVVFFDNIKSFFFSQISKILDEIVPEEKTQNKSDVGDGFNLCRSEILDKIKLFKE